MTTQYLDVVLTDLQREFELARSKPRHRVPQPPVPSAPLRSGLHAGLDSLRTAQHMLEMFGRTLPTASCSRRKRQLIFSLSGMESLRTAGRTCQALSHGSLAKPSRNQVRTESNLGRNAQPCERLPGVLLAERSGLSIPVDRLLPVFGYTFAVFVHRAEVIHRTRIPPLRGSAVPI